MARRRPSLLPPFAVAIVNETTLLRVALVDRVDSGAHPPQQIANSFSSAPERVDLCLAADAPAAEGRVGDAAPPLAATTELRCRLFSPNVEPGGSGPGGAGEGFLWSAELVMTPIGALGADGRHSGEGAADVAGGGTGAAAAAPATAAATTTTTTTTTTAAASGKSLSLCAGLVRRRGEVAASAHRVPPASYVATLRLHRLRDTCAPSPASTAFAALVYEQLLQQREEEEEEEREEGETGGGASFSYLRHDESLPPGARATAVDKLHARLCRVHGAQLASVVDASALYGGSLARFLRHHPRLFRVSTSNPPTVVEPVAPAATRGGGGGGGGGGSVPRAAPAVKCVLESAAAFLQRRDSDVHTLLWYLCSSGLRDAVACATTSEDEKRHAFRAWLKKQPPLITQSIVF